MKLSDLLHSEAPSGAFDNFEYDPMLWDTISPNSRTTLIYMSPETFLSLVQPDIDDWKLDNTTDLANRGIKYSTVPFLNFVHNGKGTAKVVGHEGRHRARVLATRNVKNMPVILRSIESGNGEYKGYGGGHAIRWGIQNKSIIWPTILIGEDGKNRIQFPINSN